MKTATRGQGRGALPQVLKVSLRGLVLAFGAVAFVVALKGFIQPNQLLAGGIGGASLLLERFFAVPVGLLYFLLNIPIFALGVRMVGRQFAVYSGVAVVLTWVMADWLPIPRLTDDPMLAGIFGGAASGIGSALAMKAGGSLGGFDIVGVVMNRRFSVGVGEVLLGLNGLLVGAAGLTGSLETAMYTLIGIFITRWTIDSLTSSRPRKAFLIMTGIPATIADRVLRQMSRGVTALPARGGWTGDELTALLCVVTEPEMGELAEIVREADPDAFVVVLEASQVAGRFQAPSAWRLWQRLKGAPRPA